MSFPRIVAISVALLGLAATPARAATVKVVVEPPGGGQWANVEYRSAPGEVNRVELFTVSDTTVRVVDLGAGIAPGAGCASVDTHTASCTTAGFNNETLLSVNVFVGDLDDVVTGHGPLLNADGGSGDDHIESSRAVGTLNGGGGGHDVLLGGGELIDGDITGAADSDVMDGREGGARVSYAERIERVVVDLAPGGPAGEHGEGDVLRNVTHAAGGAGADVLRGSDGANSLDGGPGDDHLYGNGGIDTIVGGPGNDRVSGGSGGDSLYGDSGDDRLLGSRGPDFLYGGPDADLLRGGPGPDSLTSGTAQCGRGYDTVFASAERDRLRHDCEDAAFRFRRRGYDFAGIGVTPYPVKRDSGSLTFRAECPYGDLDGITDLLPIKGILTLKAAGRVIARGPIPARAKRRCTSEFVDAPVRRIRLPVALNRAGRRLLADERPTHITLSFSGRNLPQHPFVITLR